MAPLCNHQGLWEETLVCLFEKKLIDSSRPTKPLTLIYLGNDYHVFKFNLENNNNKALYERPWFMVGNFDLVRKWEPNFVPHMKSLTHMAI